MRFGYLLLVGTASVIAADTCASCHPKQAEAFASTGHRNALHKVTSQEAIAGLKFAERDGTWYDYEALPAVRIHRGGAILPIQLEWAFGNGKYGITYVGRLADRWFEHRLSYFSDSRKPDFTPGHSRAPVADLRDAVGMIQSTEEANRCFNCHATNVRPGPDLSRMIPGVHCERCHGPGEIHAAAASAKNILNPGRFGVRQQVQICGECHRTPGPNPSPEPELDNPLSVRFQPVGLMVSMCFQKSGKLSCSTCHDVHKPLRTDRTFYDGKCKQCHAPGVRMAKSKCPRSADCASCHMPKSNPAPHLTFTDHRIREF